MHMWDNGTVELHYNKVLGTMKITLLYQVSHYIRVKNIHIDVYKELGPAKLPCYKSLLKHVSRVVIAFIIELYHEYESKGRPCHCAAVLCSLTRGAEIM